MDAHNSLETSGRTISCKNVPQSLINKKAAKQYFNQFGSVVSIVMKPKSQIITVIYNTAEAAENALREGGSFEGATFAVSRDSKPVIKRKRTLKENDQDWTLDPEVQDELKAMGQDFSVARKYNTRPQHMDIDLSVVPPKKERKVTRKRVSELVSKPSNPKPKVAATPITTATEIELLNIMKQPATTVEEKYRILDARDKLIRLRQKNQGNLIRTKQTVGTCPDMCPEKERLMREVQHQIALYEQEEDRTMNHSIAVKQYSRSSADQESPLPHELRNVQVLQMTMGYLLHKILDLCDSSDVNLAEWFHFLWDRTRGIRKDITQQELCCEGSVELVEQCARFHIHCSSRLVAEDPSVFDQKINTENLTKCLQTLKYMYHDLELKDVRCPNEAEFRAYIILLNLNDGNFMWEVQQLRREIRESRAIHFALEVHSALDKNNYVKFFKLVQSTNYLNACILLRYFIQVRIKAVRTIIKCYSPRATVTMYPVDELCKILAFEDVPSAIDFLEYYGLSSNLEGTHVILSKQSFSFTKIPYMLDRAVSVVEAKRNRSVGEVVCGKRLPFPSHENHVVSSSFDERGYLISENVENARTPERTSGAKKMKEVKKDIFAGFMQTDSSSSNSSPFQFFKPTEQVIATESVFGGVTLVPKQSDQVDAAPKAAGGGFKFTFSQPSADVQLCNQNKLKEAEELERREQLKLQEEQERAAREVEMLLRQAAEKKLREQQRMRELELKRLREIADLEKLEFQKKQLQQQIEEKKKEKREQRRIKMIERQKQEHDVKLVMDKLLNEVEKRYKEHRLSELREQTITRHVIAKWRKKVMENKRKLEAMDHCPLWVSNKSPRETADELHTLTQDKTLELMTRYKRGSPDKINTKVLKLVDKIDLEKLTYRALFSNYNTKNYLYWKLNIYVPVLLESRGFNIIEDTLNDYLGWERTNKYLRETRIGVHKITYCLQKITGKDVNDEANGFIFIADSIDNTLIKKISDNFRKLKQNVSIPVVLILQEYEGFKAKLNWFVEEGYISKLKILTKAFSQDNIIYMFNESLMFLALNGTHEPKLELNTLKAFLEENLTSTLWRRISTFTKCNIAFADCLTSPNIAIALHNEAIKRLKGIALNASTHEYADFPKIFKTYSVSDSPDYLPCDYKYFPNNWKDTNYRRYVHKKINSLKLPKYTSKWPPLDQKRLESDLHSYCKFLKNPDVAFLKIMAWILNNFNIPSGIASISWSGIVEILCLELINSSEYNLPKKCATSFPTSFVIYETERLQAYNTEAWFYLSNPIIKSKINIGLNILEDDLQDPLESFIEEDIDLDAIEASCRKNEDSFEEFRSFNAMLQDLEGSLEYSKCASRKFDDILQTLLDKT